LTFVLAFFPVVSGHGCLARLNALVLDCGAGGMAKNLDAITGRGLCETA